MPRSSVLMDIDKPCPNSVEPGGPRYWKSPPWPDWTMGKFDGHLFFREQINNRRHLLRSRCMADPIDRRASTAPRTLSAPAASPACTLVRKPNRRASS